MKNDRSLIISVGNNRKDINWKRTELTIGELYDRIKTPIRGTETIAEYFKMKKSQQGDLKDVGGFVGGELSAPRRKANHVIGRDVITLDFDNIPGYYTYEIIDKMNSLGCGYCIYSTRKHIPSKPRLRILIPTNRTASPDEYEPCARRIAEQIGIEMADPTTFELSRLMFWPSCSADSEYVYVTKDAPLINVDFLLSTYADWHDYLSWPQVPNAVSYAKLAAKQGDPLEKDGVVGAFCRTYDIEAAMDKFLPGVYEPVDNDDNRYTYLGGTTTGGAVVYDNGVFLYSHHATDPCSGRLVNAFDMVRLHKFGDLDDAADINTPVSRLPSHLSMVDFALEDKGVIALLNQEKMREIEADFGGLAAEDPDDWGKDLKRNKNGQIQGTIDNVLKILNGDPQLKNGFALNQFASRGEVLSALPWCADEKRRLWSDTDSHGLYWYMEKAWEITNRGNIDAALDLHAATHAFNDVQNFLNSLEWDGMERLDRLFVDYLGAVDTAYNRAVCRKAFTAAVARAMNPGCKYDTMLILSGPQGIGKSTLLDKMSLGWFNDNIRTFEGKDASELLQGVWLVEISELDAFRKTDVNRIKQFLSLRADRYRAAYGRHVKEIPRCCVFFGTTNTKDFLQDSTGNRRFWPVDVGEIPHTKTVWKDLTADTIAQIWAEAKARWLSGEELYLTGALETEAKIKQEEHREISVREGIIQEFVSREVPEDWAKWSLEKRLLYWGGAMQSTGGNAIKTVPRDRICAVEIWCELFVGKTRDMKQSDTREINAVLSNLEGFRRCKNGIRFGPYNVQRGYEKVKIGQVLH